MIKIILGALIILAGAAVGSYVCFAGLNLADTFPPHKTFGQNAAVFAICLAGFMGAVVVAEIGGRLILKGRRSRAK